MSQQINFNVNGEPIITIDEQGFHYRTRFIEDAGEAHKLFISVMKLLKHQNKVIEDRPSQEQPVAAPAPEPVPAPAAAPTPKPRKTAAKKAPATAKAATPIEEKKPRTRRKKTDLPSS